MPRSEADKTKNIDLDLDIEITDLTIGPDIEVLPDPTEPSAITLGPDLSLHVSPLVQPDKSVVEPEPLEIETTPGDVSKGRKLIDRLGPEVTAGLVIVAMFAIFAGLMLLGVNDQPTAPPGEVQTEEITPAPVAPEIPVEIGEGVTLERE